MNVGTHDVGTQIEEHVEEIREKIDEHRELMEKTINDAAEKAVDEVKNRIESVSEMARCNKAAMLCHTIEGAVISVAYFAEFLKGDRSLLYVLATMILAMCAPVIEFIIYKKDKDSKILKHVIGYGFAVFYIFIILTTNNILAFTYAIPMLIAISVYNNYKYSIPINVGVIIVNMVQVALFFAQGIYTKETMATVEIQVAVTIIVSVYSMYTSKVLEVNSKLNARKIKEQGEATEHILNTTMQVSNKMVEDIEIINQKVSELSNAISATRDAMSEVNSGSTDTAEAVQRQLEQTEDIQQKVESVESGTAAIIDSMKETRSAISAGNNNVEMLVRSVHDSVESGRTVSSELLALGQYMEKMNSIVDIITEITTQTSLLALNASIEAARAGEAGKGFAVVASEISKMADGTQDATVRITGLIENVSEAINRVVSVSSAMIEMIEGQNSTTAKTAESFEIIGKNSDNVYENAQQLAEIVRELANANREIVDSISTISAISEEVAAHANDTYAISEQNGVTVSDVVAVSENLRNLAQKLHS